MQEIKFGKEIVIDEWCMEDDVIGKYAYNKRHNHGGTIISANERGFTLTEGTWHPTITGDCIYDSFTINGYKIYEPCKR